MNRMAALIALCMLCGVAVRVSGQGSLYSYRTDGNSFVSNVFLNEIPTKAFRHFRKTYPFAAEEKWVKSRDGFSAYFRTGDSVTYSVKYDRGGHYTRTMIYYRKGRLPAQLTGPVKIAYPGFSVLYTSEMDDQMNKSYEVMMTDSTNVKVVDISGGEMKTVLDYQVAPDYWLALRRMY
ncbi:MAG TPA: hypothetical protein VHE54_01155 [Puia sp.]|nr:hypothetical protein [Puia sp.]